MEHFDITQPFLAMTAQDELWDTTRPIVFLGQWCRRYSRRALWKPLGDRVVASPWKEPQDLKEAFQYCGKVYQIILPLLASALNKVHQVSHTDRYWQIVLGFWLRQHIFVIYYKYQVLRNALREHPKLKTLLLARESFVIPVDFLDYYEMIPTDFYNLQLFSSVLDAMGLEFPRKQLITEHQVHSNESAVSGPFHIRLAKNLIKLFWQLNRSKAKLIFKNSYFPVLTELRLFFMTRGRICQAPANFNERINYFINREARKELQSYLGTHDDNFIQVLFKVLPFDMPQVFLEGFSDLIKTTKTLYPFQPKVIFSANSWYFDESFKVWSAEASEKGTFLVGMQHGGNYGSVASFASENHELSITDRYFTWGWDRKALGKKVIPALSNKLAGTRRIGASNKKTGILYTITTAPRYLTQESVEHAFFAEYSKIQEDFVSALSKEMLPNLRVRPHRDDYGWDFIQRWSDRHSLVKIEKWDIRFMDSLERCKIFACDHLSTTFMESLGRNCPTILFWKPEFYPLMEEARPYYDRLRQVGILFNTPEEAAQKIHEVYEDVELWWNNKELQDARKTFCHQFTRTSPNALHEWSGHLMGVIDTVDG